MNNIYRKYISIGLLFFLIILLVLRLVLIFSYSSDIGGIENNVIYNISKLLSCGKLYDNPNEGNFNVTQYTPLYYNLFYFIAKLLQFDSLNHLHHVYVLGRFLSFLFNIFGGILLFKILHFKIKLDVQSTLLLLVIYFYMLTRIHFSARPDALFSLVFIFIIYKLLNFNFTTNFSIVEFFRQYFLISLLISCSILIKQSGIQFLFILPIFLFIRKKILLSVLYFLYSIIITFLLFYFSWLFYGDYLFENIIGGVDNGFSLMRIYYVFIQFYHENMILFFLAFLTIILFFINETINEYKVLVVSLLVLFLFSIFTSAKEGSWINYYNEFLINALILIGFALKKYSFYYRKSKLHLIFPLYFMLFYFPLNLFHKLYDEHFYHIKVSKDLYEEKLKIAKVLKNKMEKHTFFLSLDPDFNSMIPLKAILPNKDFVPYQRNFNRSKFHHLLQKGYVKYVLTNNSNSTIDFINEDFSKFHKVKKYKNYTLYIQ